MYFTVLCDPHPLPLSLPGRGEIPQQAAAAPPSPVQGEGAGGGGLIGDKL